METVSLLEVNDLSFSFGEKRVLDNISFSAEKGEIIAILGPNGAGKTTLLRLILNLLKPDGGEVLLHQKNIRHIPVRELFSSLSYVPQHKGSPVSYTVLETVLMGRSNSIGLFSVPKEKDTEDAEALLSELGIAGLSGRSADTISGGELQMVMIARALISKPEVLILDEPESGLDFKNQLVVLDTLLKLKEKGVTCIFNTHYPEHAYRYADKALLIHDHRAEFGVVEEVISEDRIEAAFDVMAAVGEIEKDGEIIRTVVPVKRL